MKVTVGEYLDEYKIYGRDNYPKGALLEFLVDKGYITRDKEVNLFNPAYSLSEEHIKEFRDNNTFDVIVFTKGGKQILANEGVSYEKARKICSSEDSRGQSYFAGFTIHGAYKDIEKGDSF